MPLHTYRLQKNEGWKSGVGLGAVVSELKTFREILLQIRHLKVVLAKDRPELSDEGFANLLNEFGAKTTTGWKSIKPGRMQRIRNGNSKLSLAETANLQRAILALMKERNLSISLGDLESRYASDLPVSLRQLPNEFFQGEELGDTAITLYGAWRFFYVSPVNRNDEFKPEIRSFAAFVHRAHASSRAFEAFLVSSRSSWRGQGFVNQSHLYLIASDLQKTETAFFLTNKPSKVAPMIAGIGAALERDSDRQMRAAEGVISFAEKWKPRTTEGQRRSVRRLTGGGPINELIQRAVDGELITSDEQNTIRAEFCSKYRDMDHVKERHPELFDYLRKVKINNERGFPLRCLYVDWM